VTVPVTDRVGVIGGGTMGVGIAYVFAAAGSEVILVEPAAEQAQRATAVLAEQAEKAKSKGKLDAAVADALPGRVSVTGSMDALDHGLDIIVEAVPERADLKHSVLTAAEQRAPTLLGTNTSGLSIDELGGGLRRPENFIGLHFFNPVWSMPLVEIIRGAKTSEQTLRAAQDAVSFIGKESIVVADVPGFATSRLGVAIGLEAMRMLADGVAEAADIDRAMELGYRHPMGPLRLSDLVGLDVRLDIARSLARVYGPRFDPPQILIDKVEAGELGKKTGRGFYDWS
jgi:3-hydroxybutyryl-CoA dehydrogenase